MLVHCPGCSLNYELGLSDYGEKIECSCGKKFYANIETIIKCQELSIDYTSLYDKPEDDFEKRNIPNRIEPGKVYYIIGKTNGFFCSNKILQEWIARTGGNVAGILDKSVDYAIVADERKRSGKVDYAHKAGIRRLLIRDVACMLSNSPDLPEWEWGVIAKPRGKLCLDNSVSSQKEQWEDHGLITKKKISEILPGDSAVFNFQYRYYDKTRDHSDDHAKFMRNQPLDEKTEVALAKADNELRKQVDQLNWGYNIGISTMDGGSYYQFKWNIELIIPPGKVEIAEAIFQQLYQLLPKSSYSSLNYALLSEREHAGQVLIDKINQLTEKRRNEPSPTIIIECPECRKYRYEVEFSMLGQKVECVCGGKFKISVGDIVGGNDPNMNMEYGDN